MKMRIFLLIGFLFLGASQTAFAWGGCSRGEKWRNEVKVIGRIIKIRPPLAVLETPQGETLYIRLGPYQFWKAMGYSLRKGEKVIIRGYRCGDIIFPKVIRHRGGKIRLRNEKGIPLWRKYRSRPGW
ncbi:hypothetical protein [Thermosulfurimonas dismutans]|uniref:Uncharacterized protein n=1 Tax=Thermosulfurimonas dismutans TaxID=999894 RepID=A0A179D5U7_9BACT|nr:hypothetical protein [Thermosulfurimonas dismutans]OAQ20978.1 hypothetical protein TDIS_0904 [Thermosulfurimonas dismutans]